MGSAFLLGLALALAVGLSSTTSRAETGVRDAGSPTDTVSGETGISEDATHTDDGGASEDATTIDDGGLVGDGGASEDATRVDDGGLVTEPDTRDESSEDENSARDVEGGGCNLSSGNLPGTFVLLLMALVFLRLEIRTRSKQT
jgi:hypothetical protein